MCRDERSPQRTCDGGRVHELLGGSRESAGLFSPLCDSSYKPDETWRWAAGVSPPPVLYIGWGGLLF